MELSANYQKISELIERSSVLSEHLAVDEKVCLLYTSPSPRDAHESRMPSSA